MNTTIGKLHPIKLFENDKDAAEGLHVGIGTSAGHNQLVQWPPQRLNVAVDWLPVLHTFMAKRSAAALESFLQTRLEAGAVVYPSDPLRALKLTALADVRVVILGQDPYHGAGQAEGLAFSVAKGVKIPPSLRNIFKEIQRDLGHPPPSHGSLISWAQQGVLLLNTSLTVEDGQAASHAKQGWEALTDAIIAACAAQTRGIVFMLWGAHAQSKRNLIAQHGANRHLLLQANHPSPLSALRQPQPFAGCGHFGLAQHWLASAYPDLADTKSPRFTCEEP